MQNEKDLTPGQLELESALGKLRPSQGVVNRDQLMFRAGISAGQKRNRRWQVLTMILTVALGISVLYHPAAWTIEKKQYLTTAPQQSVHPLVSTDFSSTQRKSGYRSANYIKLRNKVLTDGIDALPQRNFSYGTTEPPMTRRELLRMMLST